MKFEVVFTNRPVRDLKKLDKPILLRIKTELETLSESPLTNSEKLINSALGTYRFRVGDYRIIYDIDENKIVILRIGHRREIYRRR